MLDHKMAVYMNEIKKLKRSNNKMIGGVCAGLADYLNLDVTIVRVLWVLFTCFVGAGLLAYIVCLVVMPTEE